MSPINRFFPSSNAVAERDAQEAQPNEMPRKYIVQEEIATNHAHMYSPSAPRLQRGELSSLRLVRYSIIGYNLIKYMHLKWEQDVYAIIILRQIES